MVTDTTKVEKSRPLLPVRHPDGDLFICDVMDAIPKDDMASMEHPIFTLSTKPDKKVRQYEHGDVKIEVVPSVKGLATIHDKDVLIYCISQLVAKLNNGEEVGKRLGIRAYDLLVATNRETSGDGYRRLRDAFERLRGTQVTTDIETGGKTVTSGFGLIDSWNIERETKGGRMTELTVVLSDWVFNAIEAREVLTLHRDYFRLRRPIERRVYELARKHCGGQREWKIGLDLLRKKTGSTSPLKQFKYLVTDLAKHNHLPNSSVRIEDKMVIFENRARAKKLMSGVGVGPFLKPDTLNQAFEECLSETGVRIDKHAMFEEWKEFWIDTGCPKLKAPDKAFIAFAVKRAHRM